ncbi:BMP family lipoprotein [Actinomadura parmotrematis]|uniref:BMP family lipoprotein n=1 Tax=Actinomadura parmotrematis TaxID=2864039 RepID=UPI0027E2A1FC|nr:BMP family ABC transporter substrate-binding protein [Actinomadura parmotrematis]
MRRALKISLVTVTGAALTLSASACGGKKADSGDGGDTKKTIKVGLAYDIGGRGDKSFNDAAYEGLQQAKKTLNVDVKDLEATKGESDNDKQQRLDLLASSGYNPVVAVGFAYAGPLGKVAAKYPNTKFAIVDDSSVKAANVTNLLFAANQGSYLVGAAAALKSKSGTVGFLGGVDTPLIKSFEAGYTAGAKKANPKIKVDVKYISRGTDFSGFSDPAKGKTIAEGQYDAGADVIYHAAGASGNGLFDAAIEKKKFAIGVDSDQYLTAKPAAQPYIVTSMLKRVDTAVFNFVEDASKGTTKAGEQTFDLKNDGIGYAVSNPEAIKDVQAKLDELKKQIIDGTITVPNS